VLRLYSPSATEQRMVMWDNRPHRIVFSTALSARIADVFAIGLGISGLGDANGVVTFDLGTRPGRAVSDSSINASLPTRFAPVIGVIVTPNENLRFGLRYTEELALHVKLDTVANVTLEGTALRGTTLVRSFGTEYFTPREIAAGGSIDVGALTLSGELAWQQWSRIDSVSYDVELQVDLGVDTPVHAFHAPPPGYHDVFVPHLGADYRIPIGTNRELVPRAGFWFAPSPVPEQTGVTNYGDADRVAFTAGAGFRFEDLGFPITLELAVQLHHLLDRENHKKDPVQPGGDFSVGGNAYVGALGLRAEF
jgi:long-chain fatty acid transport protein